MNLSSTFGPAFYSAIALFTVGTVLALGSLVFRNRVVMWVAYGAHAAGLLAITVLMAQRWAASGHPPLSGLFDAIIFYAWSIMLAYLVAEAIWRTHWLGLAAGMISLIMLFYANQKEATVQPLMPVLRSGWLYIHVITYMISYGILTIAFATAIIFYFYLVRRGENSLTRRFDSLTYQLVAFAFPLLTAGVITGAVWANKTWGTYWGWDPKETWSLITWIVYAAYLHLRLLARAWRMPFVGRSAWLNWVAVLGYAALLITFFFLGKLPSAQQSQHIYTE